LLSALRPAAVLFHLIEQHPHDRQCAEPCMVSNRLRGATRRASHAGRLTDRFCQSLTSIAEIGDFTACPDDSPTAAVSASALFLENP
jgi:hypothetical protein